MKKILLLLLLINLTFVSADEMTCETYDDFSSNTLSSSKWYETLDRISTPTWIALHKVENETYHVKQMFYRDGGVRLVMNRQIQENEIVVFDIIYTFEDLGNHWMCAFLGTDSGWNGGLSCFGSQLGTYHFQGHYKNGEVTTNITYPNGDIINKILLDIPTPTTFSVVSRLGHNSAVDIEYDNFKICSAPQPPPPPPPPCIENWNCTNWTGCIEETQTRICNDLSECGTNKDKPEELRACFIIIQEVNVTAPQQVIVHVDNSDLQKEIAKLSYEILKLKQQKINPSKEEDNKIAVKPKTNNSGMKTITGSIVNENVNKTSNLTSFFAGIGVIAIFIGFIKLFRWMTKK